MNDIQIKKMRTDSTADVILEIIARLDLTSLMSSIFVYTEDEFAKELIKRYEFKLIEAYENKDTFRSTLHLFYQETAHYIKKHQLYKEFYSFCYFIFTSLLLKKTETERTSSRCVELLL